MPTINAEFRKYYLASLKKQLPDLEPRAEKLRVSGFPYCGLRHAYLKLTNYVEPPSDAMMSYYTGVGTAAHSVFQRWLAASGKVYGAWYCKPCRRKVRFGCTHLCSKCGSEMEYVEFTVTAFDHVSGHLDGVFKDKNGEFWVIDYKTSSTFVIDSQRRNPTLPYVKNLHQIRTYVPLIEKQFDIKVAGWILVYCARDTPTKIHVESGRLSEKTKANIIKRVKSYDDQYQVVQTLSTPKQLDYLCKTKFCTSHEHYLEHMKGFKACPLESVCFTKQLKRVMLRELETVKD